MDLTGWYEMVGASLDEGSAWLQKHLYKCYQPILNIPWVLLEFHYRYIRVIWATLLPSTLAWISAFVVYRSSRMFISP